MPTRKCFSAMSRSQRQEVFNVVLAQLLQERGAVVAPESIMYTGTERTRQMPDVIVSYQGLRTAIEGEVEAPTAKEKAKTSAMRRVETGVAHIGIGVVYPKSLREVAFSDLKDQLAQADLEIVVTTESGDANFTTGNVDYLERTLRNTFEHLIKEDVVAEAVALLDVAIDKFAAATLADRGNWGRISKILNGDDVNLDELTAEQRGANCRIGGLIIINAMIFHDILSRIHDNVTPLLTVLQKDDALDVFPAEWKYILDNINFYSIFHIAREVYINLTRSAVDVPPALKELAQTAMKISERRAALRHDLMGRVYHRLLSEAKYLGTYYTSIPAATLLLKLALRPQGWDVEWADTAKLGDLRVADLSCGTGTLLMAAAETIADNHITAASSAGKPVDLEGLHKQIAESILYGYDVLASAVHLTASTLALRTPEVPFHKMNLFALPLGGPNAYLGSIELLQPTKIELPIQDLFGGVSQQAQQVTGTAMEEVNAPFPQLDLCVMNPPFVRSVGGNLLFGSMPERADMQAKLRRLVRQSDVSANITSGLGGVFIAIGDRRIKPNGRLALVLPKSLLSGVSWGESRDLINRKYRIDYVLVSHDPQRWNFSDSTELSEVLLVATKNAEAKAPEDHQATIVNLWRNPTTALETLALINQLEQVDPPNLMNGQGVTTLMLQGEKAAEVIKFDWSELRQDWFFPCAFAQSELLRVAYHLLRGSLILPASTDQYSIKLAKLGSLGRLGPDRRDIHDGFDHVDSTTNYPTYWGHDSTSVLSIAAEPNGYLQPLETAKRGRPLRRVSDLWPLASEILIAERMWLKTQRIVSLFISEPVLSNVWWTFAIEESLDANKPNHKVLALWLNSTLGLINLFVTRDETRGAWVDFKKPSLGAMPVLDIRQLSEEQLCKLAAAYDEVCHETLRPLPQMAEDETRAKIDAAIADALGLPDFSILRKMLAREPVVCMERL